MIYAIKKIGLRILAVGLSIALAIPGFSAGLKSGRLYPMGKITIYRDNRAVGEFSGEAPLPEGLLLAADGRCGIKMESIYLVAEDKSLFSVAAAANLRELLIKQGTVYFAVSESEPSLNVITPAGSLTVLNILLNASTNGRPLKGYVAVKENGSELGIIEGGSMIVATKQGEMMIKSGQRLMLAQADMDIGAPEKEEPAEKKESPKAPEEKAGMLKNKKIIIGAVGAGVLAAGVGALAGGGGGGGGSDGGGPVSPSSPTP